MNFLVHTTHTLYPTPDSSITDDFIHQIVWFSLHVQHFTPGLFWEVFQQGLLLKIVSPVENPSFLHSFLPSSVHFCLFHQVAVFTTSVSQKHLPPCFMECGCDFMSHFSGCWSKPKFFPEKPLRSDCQDTFLARKSMVFAFFPREELTSHTISLAFRAHGSVREEKQSYRFPGTGTTISNSLQRSTVQIFG